MMAAWTVSRRAESTASHLAALTAWWRAVCLVLRLAEQKGDEWADWKAWKMVERRGTQKADAKAA